MSGLSRSTFLGAATSAALAATAGSLSAAERRVNNVLIENDRVLLPGWETLTEADDAGVAKTLDLVAEASKLLAAKGIGLLLVSIPFKARYSTDVLPAGAISEGVASRYARSLQAMQARGLQTVDLDAVMRPLQTGAQTAYYPTDQHWTAPSVDAAGTAIAAAIKANWNVAERGKRDPLPALVVEKHVGDLATLLPPADRALIGSETYRLRTAYDADLTGYNMFTGAIPVADDSPLVQVVGSSFVRPMWGLPQKISNVLGAKVGLTFFNGDVGPYHTLLMNVRSTLPQRRPNVVVWQMTEANLHLGPAATGWWAMSALMSPDFFLTKMRDAIK